MVFDNEWEARQYCERHGYIIRDIEIHGNTGTLVIWDRSMNRGMVPFMREEDDEGPSSTA